MADLTRWCQSAKARYERYQKDRGEAQGMRPNRRGPGFGARTVKGNARELCRIADKVPPL